MDEEKECLKTKLLHRLLGDGAKGTVDAEDHIKLIVERLADAFKTTRVEAWRSPCAPGIFAAEGTTIFSRVRDICARKHTWAPPHTCKDLRPE